MLCRTGEFCRLEGLLQQNMWSTLEVVNEDGRDCNSSLLGGCEYESILLVHGALNTVMRSFKNLRCGDCYFVRCEDCRIPFA